MRREDMIGAVRILLAPDRFAGTLSAAEAAEAIAEGWRRSAPADVVQSLPLSDGGPGFLDVVQTHLGGEVSVVTVHGPLGEPVPARVLVEGSTAYVEAAEAVGLHLVGADERDPAGSSTEGVGELLAAAVDTGAARVVVGVGGTATTDGGQGLVAALDGLEAARARVAGVELVAATATDAPLMGHSGAAHGFAEGKGADRPTRESLEESLRTWATETDGGLAVRPGAGAGGGLGFGLLLLGAARVNGTELVCEIAGLAGRVADADLALTGQAVFDWEALRGRVVVAVARAAQQAGRPTVVLAERVEVGRRELSAAGVDAAYAVADLPRSDAGHSAGAQLSALAQRVARTWSR
ncbi:MAG TPA: glycerate kinase [Actinomycetes bacterium]|nr:glycerate kinase [Actinomycetes bacterium]